MPSCGLCILSGICWICYLILEFFENLVNIFFSERRVPILLCWQNYVGASLCRKVLLPCSSLLHNQPIPVPASISPAEVTGFQSCPNWSNQAAWSTPYPEDRRVCSCCLVWVFLNYSNFLKIVIFLSVRFFFYKHLQVSCRCYISLMQN